jgi:hypothetical protein
MSGVVDGSGVYLGNSKIAATCSICGGQITADVVLKRRPVSPVGEAWFGVEVTSVEHDCCGGPAGPGERWTVAS